MMLCTKCSHEIKPIVALDLDGTLTNYHGTYENFSMDYLNYPRVRETWRGKDEFEDHLGLTKAQYREAKLAYRQGGMKRLQPIYPGVGKLIRAIRHADAEIWLTTTRPWNRYDSTDPDTVHWLNKYNVDFDHLLYDDLKYERLASIVDPQRVCAVLEDLTDQYASAVRMFGIGVPILVKRPHNEVPRRLEAIETVAVDLVDAAAIIVTRIRNWRISNG